MPKQRTVYLVSAIAALLVAAYMALSLKWYCDDTFATLRYSEQFLAGNGFVFNTGERVEGYSNFLWLLILSLTTKLGLDPLATALNLGVVGFLGTVLVLCFVSYRFRPAQGLLLPLAALALAANFDAAVWATGGLETSLYTLLLTLAFAVHFATDLGVRRRHLLAATFLALAAMTRPDGLLLYAMSGVVLLVSLLRRKRSRKTTVVSIGVFAVPLLVLYVPYAIWKISFYGDFFPNAYYVKSGGASYFSQGFYYLWLYFLPHFTSLLCLLGGIVLWCRGSRGPTADSKSTEPTERDDRPAVIVAVVCVVAYLVGFVAKVGGDFMYARFVVPVMPLVYFMGERALARLSRGGVLTRVALPLLLVVVVLLPETIARNRLMLATVNGHEAPIERRGVVDEQFYYTRGYPIERDRQFGTWLRPYFEGLDATVLLSGQLCLGYYGGFKTCITKSGLADAFIARQELAGRGRIGHEKSAPYDYLLERGVNFVFSRRLYREDGYRQVEFSADGIAGQFQAEMITYDAELMAELSERLGHRMGFVSFEWILDDYILQQLESLPLEQVRRHYEDFKEFYFDHNDDPSRQAAFVERLERG